MYFINNFSGNMRPDPTKPAQISEPFSPVIDNQILTDQPSILIAKL